MGRRKCNYIKSIPAEIKLTTNYSWWIIYLMVFMGTTYLNPTVQKLVEEFANLGRPPNEFILRPKNTADGIYYVSLPLVKKKKNMLY